MKLLLMDNVYIIFLPLTKYYYLLQDFTYFVVKVRIRNFRKISNFTGLRLTRFMFSLFLNTAEYTKRLMICQTFMKSPFI